MDQASVVEHDKVTLLPIVRVDHLGTNARPLKVVDHLAHLLKIVDDSAVGKMQLADGGRMDLKSQATSDWVAPAHGQDLDLLLLDGWQAVERNFFALGHKAETIGAGLGAAHPNIRMRSILDFAGANKLLVFRREPVVHGITRDEGRSAKGNSHLLARVVIVNEGLLATARDLDCKQRGHNWWGEAVKGRVDVPSVEAGVVEVLLIGDRGRMESAVVRVAKLDVLQTLVFFHEAVSDDLDLGLMRNGLEVRVQNRALGIQSLAVTV